MPYRLLLRASCSCCGHTVRLGMLPMDAEALAAALREADCFFCWNRDHDYTMQVLEPERVLDGTPELTHVEGG